jgi:hypothetical protein
MDLTVAEIAPRQESLGVPLREGLPPPLRHVAARSSVAIRLSRAPPASRAEAVLEMMKSTVRADGVDADVVLRRWAGARLG